MSVEDVWDRLTYLCVMIAQPEEYGDEEVRKWASSLPPELEALKEDLIEQNGDEILIRGFTGLVRAVLELVERPLPSGCIAETTACKLILNAAPALRDAFRSWQQTKPSPRP